jgi:two-component system, LytTR family, response regulator
MATKKTPKLTEHSKFLLPTPTGLLLLNIADIVFCKASDNYTEFYMQSGKKILAIKTLKVIEQIFTPYNFIRIHKSYLINILHVVEYKRTGGEGGQLIMTNKAELDVSRLKKTQLMGLIEKMAIIIV